MGKTLKEKHKEMLNSDPEYTQAFMDMEKEFQFAGELIKTGIRPGLARKQLAEKMGTTQSAIARLESGGVKSSSHYWPGNRKKTSNFMEKKSDRTLILVRIKSVRNSITYCIYGNYGIHGILASILLYSFYFYIKG